MTVNVYVKKSKQTWIDGLVIMITCFSRRGPRFSHGAQTDIHIADSSEATHLQTQKNSPPSSCSLQLHLLNWGLRILRRLFWNQIAPVSWVYNMFLSQPRTPKQLLVISQGQDICATEIRLILPMALPPCDILKVTLTWTQGFEYHIENHSVEKQ